MRNMDPFIYRHQVIHKSDKSYFQYEGPELQIPDLFHHLYEYF